MLLSKYKNELYNLFNKNIIEIKDITDKSKIIILEDEKYFIKEKRKKTDIVKQLINQNVNSVILPIKTFKIDNEYFELYPYYEEKYIPRKTKVLMLQDAIMDLQAKTFVQKKLKKKEFKKLYRLYKKLDFCFSNLELLVRSCEMKEKKTDFDWIILSKYQTFLMVKKEMYHLQMKIHDSIDQKESVYYAINHGNPSVTHIINGKLVSLEKAYFGIFISDIAKFYCLNEDVNIDWFKTIDEWIASYNFDFYKWYFKFLALYIFIINLNIDTTIEELTLDSYIVIEDKLKKTITLFENYH